MIHPAGAQELPAAPGRPLIELHGIRKTFGGTLALDSVNFTCDEGEIHAIAGENGAGKSTLINILTGVLSPDSGRIMLRGRPVRFNSPVEADRAGIAAVYQELSLVEDLDVAQNIFLHREPRRVRGLLDARRLYRAASDTLLRFGITTIDPRAIVRHLSIADRQLVELAHALSRDATLLILDEPTSSLTSQDQERLFAILREQRAEGRSIIYISHRLEEVFELADRVTVLRDGSVVSTLSVTQTNQAELVRAMVGRDLAGHLFPPRPASGVVRGIPALEVIDLSSPGSFLRISFSVWPGEIVGIGGLVGSGRTSLLTALFGADPATVGQIKVAGRPVAFRSPRDAMRAGVAFVGEDRQRDSLGIGLPVLANLTAARLPARGPFVDRRAGVAAARRVSERVGLRARLSRVVRELSGGNQQKVAIGKWLTARPRVLLLDEPTRGIDVGAKAEIYHLIRELTAEGTAVVVVSSEMPELLGLCDRILVMHEGLVMADLDATTTSEEAIARAASGIVD